MSGPRLSLSRLHFPITSLGPGRRIGIWLQGCSIHCAGCMSRDTWKFAESERIEVALEQMAPWFDAADGVTISGGEPFDQAEGLMALLKAMRSRFSGDILAYSGYTFSKLQAEYPEVLTNIDALISEPYDASHATDLPLRGSGNQQFHLLTPLGLQRFGEIASAQSVPAHPALDVLVDARGEIWIAGVPRRGDLDQLSTLLAQQGLRLSTSAGRIGSLP